MSELTRAQRKLWIFGLVKIPLIGFVRPRILEITPSRMVVKIPLRWRTKNHLGSMYFGALGIGADLAGAFHAFFLSEKTGKKLSIVFKDFQANFLKRPERDVYFISDDGLKIEEMVQETIRTGERITQPIQIKAVINYPENPEEVAVFDLGLSVKHTLE